MNDETYVREHWERVNVCDGSYRHYAKGTILLNWANHQFYEFTDWHAAAEFTRERLKQIAEIEEEIKWLTNSHEAAKRFDELAEIATVTGRILAREQSALAELKRGMREPERKSQ